MASCRSCITLGQPGGRAYDINNARQIAGYANDANFDTRAVRWESDGPHDLGTLGGTDARAFGINEAGVVVGWSYVTDNASYVAFRHDGTSMRALGTLGGPYSQALAINDLGGIVGDSQDPQLGIPDDHAFLVSAGVMIDLLGPPTFTDSYAVDVNNLGQVVGYSRLAGVGDMETLWNRQPQRLDVSPETPTRAFSINDHSVVVGESFGRAFRWEDGRVEFLDELLEAGSGWHLLDAKEINEFGQIAGVGEIGGALHGYVLSPLPALTVSDTRHPGESVHLELRTHAGAQTVVALAPGVGSIHVGALTLDLGPRTADLVVVLHAIAPSDGSLARDFPTPDDPALLGRSFYWQGYTLHAGRLLEKSNRCETLFVP